LGVFPKDPGRIFYDRVVGRHRTGRYPSLSRSIFATLTPRAKSGEFFGLYGLSEKFAGILGPFLYSIVGALTHDPRDSIASISIFLGLGLLCYGA